MLILTRKPNEAIRVGDDIRITVVRLAGGTVRLGIEAPPQVRIVRDELPGRPPATGRELPPAVTDSAALRAHAAQTPALGGPSAPPAAGAALLNLPLADSLTGAGPAAVDVA